MMGPKAKMFLQELEKHQFPYFPSFFAEKTRNMHAIFPSASKSALGFNFNTIWKQWSGNNGHFFDILRRLYPDASIKTETVNDSAMTFIKVDHRGRLSLIIGMPAIEKIKEKIDPRPMENILSSYALSEVMARPEVYSLAVLGIDDSGRYIAGKIENMHYKGPVIEYSVNTASLADKTDKAIDQLWSIINYEGEIQEPVIQAVFPISNYRLHRCLGSGFSGTVYDATSPHDGKRKAVKVIKLIGDREIFTIQELKEKVHLESVKDFKIEDVKAYINREGRYMVTDMIVMPLGKIILPICNMPEEYFGTMKLGHFKEILEDLKAIHKAGMVHRDVRLENLVLVDDRARLIDYGSVCNEDVACTCKGTTCTASQRCLQIYVHKYDKDVKFEPRDDLESLFKTFLLWKFPENGPIVGVARAMQEMNQSLPMMHFMLFEAWKPYVAPISNLNYDQLLSFLEALFTLGMDDMD